jgi:hypothetical protein
MTIEVRYLLADKVHVREFETLELAERFIALCRQADVPATITNTDDRSAS